MKKWATNDISKAVGLRSYFDSATKKIIARFTIQKEPWSGRLIIPKGKKLHDYQKRGAEFILSRNNSYLAFQQRLGKTPTFITAMNTYIYNIVNFRGLIVVPPFLVSYWCHMLKEWGKFEHVNITLPITSGKGIGNLNELDDFNGSRIYVVADSLLIQKPVATYLANMDWDFIGVDEAHRFCNDTGRTKVLFNQLVGKSRKNVLMSGTPMPNRPIELYPALSKLALDSIEYMGRERYAKKYCDSRVIEVTPGRFVLDVSGASNTEELNTRLKDFMMVEKFADHFSVAETERMIILDCHGKVKRSVKKLEENIGNVKLKDLVNSKNVGAIAEYRNALSEEKITPALSYIKNILDNTKEQILVLGIHTNLLVTLYGELKDYNAGLIYGAVTNRCRDGIKEEFQNGNMRVLVAQVETMVGIDLSAGTRAIFVESPWSPKSIEQAKFRLIHMEQKKKIFFDHLVIADTLDEYVMKRVLEKEKDVSEVIK